jgi:hypothetical protein
MPGLEEEVVRNSCLAVAERLYLIEREGRVEGTKLKPV